MCKKPEYLLLVCGSGWGAMRTPRVLLLKNRVWSPPTIPSLSLSLMFVIHGGGNFRASSIRRPEAFLVGDDDCGGRWISILHPGVESPSPSPSRRSPPLLSQLRSDSPPEEEEEALGRSLMAVSSGRAGLWSSKTLVGVAGGGTRHWLHLLSAAVATAAAGRREVCSIAR